MFLGGVKPGCTILGPKRQASTDASVRTKLGANGDELNLHTHPNTVENPTCYLRISAFVCSLSQKRFAADER